MTENQEPEKRQGLDFYISYAGPDRLWAEWVGWQLRCADYTFVLDVWDWLPGENIILAREDALRRAGRVLSLCSAAYFSGGFTKQEWTAVMAAQHRESDRLIPVWIEDLADELLPDMLRSVQPVKLFGLPEPEARKRLLRGLGGDLAPESAPPFPSSTTTAEPEQAEGSKPRLPRADPSAVWHVPSRNPDFTGRDGLLIELRETLLNTVTGIAVLQGPSGVGKTQLSVEYAYRFASDYDAVWVIDAEQPDLIINQLADLSVAIGTTTHVTDVQLAATSAITALRTRRRWLLIFDNVENPDHLTGFLPHGPGHVLVTTRAGSWQEIGGVIAVEEFNRAESTALLTARVAAMPLAAADLLADALGDLPLALAQAAGVLQSMPAAEFQRLLGSQATVALSQGRPRSYPASLAATTLVALNKLTSTDAKAADLFCLCGYLAPESIPARWFYESAAFALPPSAGQTGALPEGILEVSQAFEHIRDLGLGRVDQKGLRLHRLTHAILRDHTADNQVAYRDLVAAVLTAAAPSSSSDPASWPDWSLLVPHLLTALSEGAPAALQRLAGQAARYLLESGQTKAALAMTGRLHETWTAELGADDTGSLIAAQYLGRALVESGDYTRAFGLQQETLQRRRRLLGDDDPDTLQSANDMATTLGYLGRRYEALALARETYGRLARVLGEDHPDTLMSAGNLAGALGEAGQVKEALALARETYGRRARVLGEDHLDTMRSANNLAGALDGAGRRKEALALAQDAYERRRRVLGDDHPDTMIGAAGLVTMLGHAGQLKEALARAEDTYCGFLRLLGEDHPQTLTVASNLAAALGYAGQRKKALALAQDTYDRRRRVLGEDHPDTLNGAISLVTALGQTGRRKEALVLAQDTYDRFVRLLGKDHPDTLTAAVNLAVALANDGRRKEGLALAQDTYDRRRRVLGEDHPDTWDAARSLARILESVGRRAEALRIRSQIPREKRKR